MGKNAHFHEDFESKNAEFMRLNEKILNAATGRIQHFWMVWQSVNGAPVAT